MASYTLQGFTSDASSPDLDATNLNEMDSAIKVGHDFADSSSATPEAGKAMVWPENASGTFTPTLSFGGSSTGITCVQQVGRYSKIGNVLYFALRLLLSSKGTASGSAEISGIPMAIAELVNNVPLSLFFYSIPYTGQIFAQLNSATSKITLNNVTEDGALSKITNSDFTDDSFICIEGFYFV